MTPKTKQVGNQWLVHFDWQYQRYFSTEREAQSYRAKIDTAKAIVSAVKSLTTVADNAADLESEYFDVGTFTNDDVSALGITADDLASCITLLQQIDKLMTNQATSAAMYRSTLNKVRRVQV